MRVMFWILLLSACAVARHPVTTAPSPTPSAPKAGVGPIVLESVVSARWAVPLKGLLNLKHPEAKAAGLTNEQKPIVLPVHILKHPSRGVFLIDTGVPRDMAEGGPGPARGLIRSFLNDIEPVMPLGDILARQEGALGGVLLTHFHLDHVLGLQDVPRGTPIYVGPGELGVRSVTNALTRKTFQATLEGHDALRVWSFEGSTTIGGLAAVDVLGDGSLWALHVPGHTPGSTAYLANTTSGPALFVGDCSHTRWGWDHGVEPGTYTADHAANAESLARLRALVEANPEIQVFVGHELTDTVAAR